jgi:hypothetical protein
MQIPPRWRDHHKPGADRTERPACLVSYQATTAIAYRASELIQGGIDDGAELRALAPACDGLLKEEKTDSLPGLELWVSSTIHPTGMRRSVLGAEVQRSADNAPRSLAHGSVLY